MFVFHLVINISSSPTRSGRCCSGTREPAWTRTPSSQSPSDRSGLRWPPRIRPSCSDLTWNWTRTRICAGLVVSPTPDTDPKLVLSHDRNTQTISLLSRSLKPHDAEERLDQSRLLWSRMTPLHERTETRGTRRRRGKEDKQLLWSTENQSHGSVN